MKTLGIDIGGTSVKAGLVGPGPAVSLFQPVKFDRNPRALLAKIKRAADGVKYGRVGIAVAGAVDSAAGVVRFSPNLGWRNVPLERLAREFFHVRASVENDASAAAYGAYILDCGEKPRNIICLTLGTGVGGGIVIDGRLYRGSTGTAGEAGHLNYEPRGVPCACGKLGCFERYLGRDAVIKRGRVNLSLAKSLRRRSAAKSGSTELTPEKISAAACEGEKWALETWRETGVILGALLADIVNLLNPEVIVLAGGISKAYEYFAPFAVGEMRARTFADASARLKIIPSRHPEILGLAGAAKLAGQSEK